MASDFTPPTTGLDDEAILRRLELDDRNLEYDNGQFIEKYTTVESSSVVAWIGHLLICEAVKTGAVRVCGPNLIYCCWPNQPRRFRVPDLTVVRTARTAAFGADARVMTIPAELAVEVIPSLDWIDGRNEKVEQYREAGFGPVWVVQLPTRVIDVHLPDGTVTRLREGDEITAGPVLPGFRRRVGELFGPPTT